MSQFIKPGSIIISDSFASYKKLEQRHPQYEHDMVNHKKNYKDPVTGACTNTVEGKWRNLKANIPRRGFREERVLQEYLAEQMWRQSNKGRLWKTALELLANYVDQDV